MTNTALAPERYFELINRDTERLAQMGERGLDLKVPACPDWVVSDVVFHTAVVYKHKVRVMAEGAFPQDWPPADFAGREPVGFLREAKDDLFAEFARHDLGEQTATFGSDTTIAFWVRRMALEVAVHRCDGEQAHVEPTPIPDDLALDGIDEMLRVNLGGPWWDGDWRTEHPLDAVVAVEAGGLRWVCDVRDKAVTVEVGDTPAQATISGSPEHVFLWVWGRLGDDAVEFAGDAGLASEFRQRIAETAD